MLKLMHLVLLFLLFLHVHATLLSNKTSETNFCSKTETYEESQIVPITKRVKEMHTRWCLGIPPLCTEYIYNTVVENKTVTVKKTRIVFDCCAGYEKIDGHCEPICPMGCGNGVCIEPEKCLCNEGWTGLFCLSECEPNLFGKGCKNKCNCYNGASCDKKTGFCYCTAGFTGEYCEDTCPGDMYGPNCQFKCQCENDGICNMKNGTCGCQGGYTGNFCEKQCEPGTHGPNCKNKCICLEEYTRYCNKTDGTCICNPGYQGAYCEKQCESNKYGFNCNNRCDCEIENIEFCDNVNGTCVCSPGWIGERCSEKCPIGKFGENCMFTCVPCLNDNAVCNHITGYCDCPAGTSGEFCTEMCPKGFWGTNCTKTCECPNDGLCSPVSGVCLCTSGLNVESNCYENCSRGFGALCSSECNCVCDEMTGKCIEAVNTPKKKVNGHLDSAGGLIAGVCVVVSVLLVVGFFICTYIARDRKAAGLDCCSRETNTTVDPADDDCMKCGSIVNPMYDSPIRRQIEGEVDSVSSIDVNPVSSSFVINFSRGNFGAYGRSSDGAKKIGVAEKGGNERSSAPGNLAARSRKSAGTQDASNEFNFLEDFENDLSKNYVPEVLNQFNILDEEANRKV